MVRQKTETAAVSKSKSIAFNTVKHIRLIFILTIPIPPIYGNWSRLLRNLLYHKRHKKSRFFMSVMLKRKYFAEHGIQWNSLSKLNPRVHFDWYCKVVCRNDRTAQKQVCAELNIENASLGTYTPKHERNAKKSWRSWSKPWKRKSQPKRQKWKPPKRNRGLTEARSALKICDAVSKENWL